MKETREEVSQDLILAIAFSVIAIVASIKCSKVIALEGTETAIKTFYLLIFGAATLRAIWFFIPSDALEPTYAPTSVKAFSTPGWAGVLLSEVFLSSGSLCLFGIFVLIIIYWADLLKKVFKPVGKYDPLSTFMYIMAVLLAIQVANFAFFLLGAYSSEVMQLVDSVELAALSLICLVEISIFSHRFRTVLTAFGAINQVSIDSQVQTIVRITIVGNVFFIIRAGMEVFLAVLLTMLWREHKPESSLGQNWAYYVAVKHAAEVVILGMMLYVLQSKKAHHAAVHAHSRQHRPQRRDYNEIKDHPPDHGLGLGYGSLEAPCPGKPPVMSQVCST